VAAFQHLFREDGGNGKRRIEKTESLGEKDIPKGDLLN
jgi:hypothetical protein